MDIKERTKRNYLLTKKAVSDERFMSLFTESYRKDRASGCYIWGRYVTEHGYGRIYFKGHHLMAHRIMFVYGGREIPEGLILDHICRKRNCVNPKHLRAVTEKENVLCGEGRAARQAKQTRCYKGHKLEYGNLDRTSKFRRCRTCKNEYQRKYQRRKRSKS